MNYRNVQIYLFDTCTHKCAYCHLAETGKVLDGSQIQPYKDPLFISKITNFFNKRVSDSSKFLLALTGGEPLLMPNFEMFVESLGDFGNRISIYTALLVGDSNPAYQYLLREGAKHTDYLMVSFHPAAEEIENQFFNRLKLLKQAGHSVIFRFVAHPQRLQRLDELAARCVDLDIAFHPTPLFSPTHPSGYSNQERENIERHMASISQIIQMGGGLDVSKTSCDAGTKLFSIDIRTGNITPCISTSEPILGNIYEDTLQPIGHSIACPNQSTSCICDFHFQQGIVHGVDDRRMFEMEKRGFVKPQDANLLKAQLEKSGNMLSTVVPNIGLIETTSFQSLPTSFVKAEFIKNKSYFHGSYTDANHQEFKDRVIKYSKK